MDSVERALAAAGWEEDPDAAVAVAELLGDGAVEYAPGRACRAAKVIKLANDLLEAGVIVFRECWDEGGRWLEGHAVFGAPGLRPARAYSWAPRPAAGGVGRR